LNSHLSFDDRMLVSLLWAIQITTSEVPI